MTEYTAMVQHTDGSKEAVTINGLNKDDACRRLFKLGYLNILWIA